MISFTDVGFVIDTKPKDTENYPSVNMKANNLANAEKGENSGCDTIRRRFKGPRKLLNITIDEEKDLSALKKTFAIYGVTIVLLGLVFPVTEALTEGWSRSDYVGSAEAYLDAMEEGYIPDQVNDTKGCKRSPICVPNTKAFHLFLFGVSVIFLSYLQFYLLPTQKKEQVQEQENQLKVSVAFDNKAFNVSEEKEKDLDLDLNQLSKNNDVEDGQAGIRGNINSSSTSTLEKDNKELILKIDKAISLHDKISGRCMRKTVKGANFYLRLGAVGFGVGGMIYSGLNLTAQVMHPNARCGSSLIPYDDALHMIFIFLQTFFIFKYSQVCIQKHQVIVLFGLIHVMATNMCVWLRTITIETTEAIYHYGDHKSFGGKRNVTKLVSSQKHRSHMDCLSGTPTYVKTASPYLFPCIIEYSLIAASITYHVTCHVGMKPMILSFLSRGGSNQASKTESTSHHGIFSYAQCQKANKGVFAGIIILVATIVIAILFFVFLAEGDFQQWFTAVIVLNAFEITVMLLMIGATVGCFLKMRGMRIVKDDHDSMEGVVLMVAFSGLILYNTFTLLATLAQVSKWGRLGAVEIMESIISALQGATQTVFILEYTRRRAANAYHVELKPGRGLVTFLILCNVSLWGVNTFMEKESHASVIERSFYGALAWNLIGHIALPLFIFYRFHSSALLAEIWQEAYEFEKNPESEAEGS